jgi:hypothetical protein
MGVRSSPGTQVALLVDRRQQTKAKKIKRGVRQAVARATIADFQTGDADSVLFRMSQMILLSVRPGRFPNQ